jgi:hypothetical protein
MEVLRSHAQDYYRFIRYSPLDEYAHAKAEIAGSPTSIPIWQVIFGRLAPGQITLAQHAQKWAKGLVTDWLASNMLAAGGLPAAEAVYTKLTDFKHQPSHQRHIASSDAKIYGLTIEDLETPQPFQDSVLAVHHSQIITLTQTRAVKIIENDQGSAYIRMQN